MLDSCWLLGIFIYFYFYFFYIFSVMFATHNMNVRHFEAQF